MQIVRNQAGGSREATLAKLLPYIQDAALVVLCAFFVVLHGRRVVVEHVYTSLPFLAENALLVGIFLFRRRSRVTSSRPVDWAIAFGGAWLPLFMHPVDSANASQLAGLVIQLAGLTGSTICMVFLGRSFGIVAANRGVKTAGPYGLVRHPIYAAHLLTITGFLVGNFDLINLVVYATVMICQYFRIHAEERVLAESQEYRTYQQAVPWRIVPGVF